MNLPGIKDSSVIRDCRALLIGIVPGHTQHARQPVIMSDLGLIDILEAFFSFFFALHPPIVVTQGSFRFPNLLGSASSHLTRHCIFYELWNNVRRARDLWPCRAHTARKNARQHDRLAVVSLGGLCSYSSPSTREPLIGKTDARLTLLYVSTSNYRCDMCLSIFNVYPTYSACHPSYSEVNETWNQH